MAKDDAEAVKWWRKAAEQNNAYMLLERGNLGDCYYKLGVHYANGQGVAKDEVEAAKWYRKAAEDGNVGGQYKLGFCYFLGQGVAKDEVEAVKWWRKAAQLNDALFVAGLTNVLMFGNEVRDILLGNDLGICYDNLGFHYANGLGVAKDEVEAVKWYRKAAEQKYAEAEYFLGVCYDQGQGVAQDHAEAVKWYREAANQEYAEAQNELGLCYSHEPFEGLIPVRAFVKAVEWYREAANQGYAEAQYNLGFCYFLGQGVSQDYVQAYKWLNLAAAQGKTKAAEFLNASALHLSPEAIAEAERLSREFAPRKQGEREMPDFTSNGADTAPKATGTGFFITDDGYLISNYHVVKDAAKVRLVTSAGSIDAKVVQVDAANDLALLKAEGNFSPLPIAASRTVNLGGTVATVGFPDIGLQGFAPKLAKGEIASLSGAADDPRYFQISVPVQPGNSGGALVDETGT